MSSLHVEVAGAGTPVLLLHSGGMSSRQWRKLAEGLASSYQAVSPDFLGSGDNPLWPEGEPFDFHQDVDAVAEIVRRLGGAFHVVGHSYGGLVALTLARQMPESVLSLAVYDPVAFGVLYDPPDAEGLADVTSGDTDAVFSDPAYAGSAAWLELFVDYWNGKGAWQTLHPGFRDGFLRVGYKIWAEVQSLLQDRTPASAYAVIHAPALLLHGERSPVAARHVVARLADAMPNARLQALAGAGHMGPITHLAQVNDAIARHIRSAG